MKALLEQIKTAAETLTAGALFARPEGGMGEIVYYTPERPPKRHDPSQGEDCPSCEIVPMGRQLVPAPGYLVHMIFLLHNDDRSQALDDLDRLQTLIDPMATRIFPGCKLQAMENFWGDRDSGIQPHPKYRLFYILRFAGQPVRTTCEG